MKSYEIEEKGIPCKVVEDDSGNIIAKYACCARGMKSCEPILTQADRIEAAVDYLMATKE